MTREERLLKKWNKNPKRHLYRVHVEFNHHHDKDDDLCWHLYEQNIYGYDYKHVRYQIYLMADKDHWRIKEEDIKVTRVI